MEPFCGPCPEAGHDRGVGRVHFRRRDLVGSVLKTATPNLPEVADRAYKQPNAGTDQNTGEGPSPVFVF